jgi:hypothetical protein
MNSWAYLTPSQAQEVLPLNFPRHKAQISLSPSLAILPGLQFITIHRLHHHLVTYALIRKLVSFMISIALRLWRLVKVFFLHELSVQ